MNYRASVPSRTRCERDRGAILPIVLVVSISLSLVVVAIATYAAGTLRQGQVVEDSADRMTAADGAMDNALEALDRGSSVCALTDLANNPGGYTYPMGDTINGIEPTITCETIGGEVNAVDAFAVIMTGAGGQTGPLLTITNGGGSGNALKTFSGPVYMALPPVEGSSMSIDPNTLTLEEGDLWYTAPSGCPDPSVSLSAGLTITPEGFGTKCLEEDWLTLFAGREPNPPDLSALPTQSATPPIPDDDGCYIWPSGRYEDPPQLVNGSYNYFASGDYFFDDIQTWFINGAYVLAGYPGDSGPSIPGWQNADTYAGNPCNAAWGSDPSRAGATFYLGGSSRIELEANSALEVSASANDGYNIGLQALPSSTVTGDTRIVLADAGTNKQLSIQGLVWAPYAALEFDTIANDAVAALTGGAVVAELAAGASANATNFVISVETQPSSTQFVFEATAIQGGSTTVRTILTYRSDNEYAVVSRRIRELTPE